MSDHYSVKHNAISFGVDLEPTHTVSAPIAPVYIAHLTDQPALGAPETTQPLSTLSDVDLVHAVHAAVVLQRLDGPRLHTL